MFSKTLDVLYCEQSLFSSGTVGKTQNKRGRVTVTVKALLLVARASEDKRKKRLHWFYRVGTKPGVGHGLGHGIGHGVAHGLPVVNFPKTQRN